MNRWLLKVELAGQWEECSYPTQAEALAAFAAVAADYRLVLSRVVLVSDTSTPFAPAAKPTPTYIN